VQSLALNISAAVISSTFYGEAISPFAILTLTGISESLIPRETEEWHRLIRKETILGHCQE